MYYNVHNSYCDIKHTDTVIEDQVPSTDVPANGAEKDKQDVFQWNIFL